MIANRRRFLFGAGAALLTAPAIVRVASLMPVSVLDLRTDREVWAATWSEFQERYRAEFSAGFEESMSLLRRTVTTEITGTATWLISDCSVIRNIPLPD